jgi:hypothetical protein
MLDVNATAGESSDHRLQSEPVSGVYQNNRAARHNVIERLRHSTYSSYNMSAERRSSDDVVTPPWHVLECSADSRSGAITAAEFLENAKGAGPEGPAPSDVILISDQKVMPAQSPPATPLTV